MEIRGALAARGRYRRGVAPAKIVDGNVSKHFRGGRDLATESSAFQRMTAIIVVGILPACSSCRRCGRSPRACSSSAIVLFVVGLAQRPLANFVPAS
jgi:hypothetical protein